VRIWKELTRSVTFYFSDGQACTARLCVIEREGRCLLKRVTTNQLLGRSGHGEIPVPSRTPQN